MRSNITETDIDDGPQLGRCRQHETDAVEGLAVLVHGTVQRDAQRRIVHRRREHAQVQLGVLDGCEDLVHVRRGCLQGNRVNGIEISPLRRYLSLLYKVFTI